MQTRSDPSNHIPSDPLIPLPLAPLSPHTTTHPYTHDLRLRTQVACPNITPLINPHVHTTSASYLLFQINFAVLNCFTWSFLYPGPIWFAFLYSCILVLLNAQMTTTIQEQCAKCALNDLTWHDVMIWRHDMTSWHDVMPFLRNSSVCSYGLCQF